MRRRPGFLQPPLIGTLRETSLHAALKQQLVQTGDRVEAPVAGFVVDILRGDLIIEVQTRGFSALKRKLPRLLDAYRVRLVHPIVVDRWIVHVDGRGRPVRRRKSPWHGRLEHLFLELVSIPELVAHPNFAFDVVFIREESIRRPVRRPARPARRFRRSAHTRERRLLEVVDRVAFDSPKDYERFLPPGLVEPFTCRDLATAIGQPLYLAQKIAYCLRKMDIIVPDGARRRAITYVLRSPAGTANQAEAP